MAESSIRSLTRIDPAWRSILARAWSVRFMAAAALLTAVDVFLPVAVPIDSLPLGVLSLVCSLLALYSRIVAQRNCP